MNRALIFLAGILAGAGAAYGYLAKYGQKEIIQVPVTPVVQREVPIRIPGTIVEVPKIPQDQTGRQEEREIEVAVGSKEMKLTSAYFGTDVPAKPKVSHIVLRLTYPGLRPAGQESPGLQVMVRNPSFRDNVEYLTTANTRTSNAVHNAGPMYGLTHFVPPEDSAVRREDMFIEKDNGGEILNMITCQLEESSPQPRCYHYYNEGELLHMLFYERKYLPEWQSIKQQVKKLLASFSGDEQAFEEAGKEPIGTETVESNVRQEPVAAESAVREPALPDAGKW